MWHALSRIFLNCACSINNNVKTDDATQLLLRIQQQNNNSNNTVDAITVFHQHEYLTYLNAVRSIYKHEEYSELINEKIEIKNFGAFSNFKLF